jgi:hypothetical protein
MEMKPAARAADRSRRANPAILLADPKISKPPGLVAHALMDGALMDGAAEDLLEKALEMALGGDRRFSRCC